MKQLLCVGPVISIASVCVCVISPFFSASMSNIVDHTGQTSPLLDWIFKGSVVGILVQIFCECRPGISSSYVGFHSLFLVFMSLHLVNRPQLPRLSGWWIHFSELVQNALPHAFWSCGERVPSSYNHSPPRRGTHRG